MGDEGGKGQHLFFARKILWEVKRQAQYNTQGQEFIKEGPLKIG